MKRDILYALFVSGLMLLASCENNFEAEFEVYFS